MRYQWIIPTLAVASLALLSCQTTGTNFAVAAETTSPSTNPTSKPSQDNTGPHGPLRALDGLTCTQPDQIIENINVTGTIAVKAANVTIRNFRVDANREDYCVRVYRDASVTLEDGELINAKESGIYGNDWTARRLNIHHMGSDGTKGGGHNTLEYSWIHHLGMDVGAHADGLQLDNGASFVIRHNNFDLPWRSKEGDQFFKVNSCFFIDGWVGPIDDVLIEDNWLNGGNYIVYAFKQSNTRVLNNRIGSGEQFGLLMNTGKPPLEFPKVIWTNNVWDETGMPAASNVKFNKK